MKTKFNFDRLPIYFSLFSLALLLILLPFLIRETQREKELRIRAQEEATLELSPSSGTFNLNQPFDLDIILNTGRYEVDSFDIILNYDPSALEAQQIERGNVPEIKAYAAQEIRDGQVLLTGNIGSDVIQVPIEGQNLLVGTVTFRPLKAVSQTAVSFDFVGPAPPDMDFFGPDPHKHDCNVVKFLEFQDILNQVTNGSYQVLVGPTPPITPTPTPPLISPTPTPTWSPTPTWAPTPTPVPGKANLTFKVKFQGINEQKPSKSVRVTLQQGIQEIHLFNSVGVNSDQNGVYTGTVTSIDLGTYDVYIKGWAHLQKKFTNVSLSEGENSYNWSGTTLLAGDFNDDNILDIDDIGLILAIYTQLSVPVNEANRIYDVNADEVVDIFDIALILSNYTELEIHGD